MPDPKKTMVKVPKSLLSDEEIKKAKEAASARKPNGNMPEVIAKIKAISEANAKAVANEAIAKNDSVLATKKHILENKNSTDPAKAKAMAGRAGNEAANETRKKTGNPDSQVIRFANVESGGKVDNSRGQQDKFIRDKPVEKDFPIVFTRVKK